MTSPHEHFPRADGRRCAIRCRLLAVLFASTFSLLSPSPALASPPGKPINFLRDVRPILSAKCFGCHGPDAAKRKGKLRLDTRDGAFQEREGRAVIVPRKPEASELYLKITAASADDRMPPAEAKKELSKDEVELLREWIAQGAPWQEHWAFQAPVRPEVPAVPGASGARNEIDRFILARLEKEGLKPSEEADRRTLARRVTLDLTGLPPTIEEVEAFAGDSSSDAYERLVERLLGSPHHGEHMARFWLDAARYGDTHGLHLDNLRLMWPYRDWVIAAFNANMPYDRFTIEQLAGDLLPEATLEQKIATGFTRCHVTTSEGGAIAEEVQVRNVVDRVSTTATVFMGLTAGCCVCHDHKYDPMTMKDYYQLYAIFNSLEGDPLDGNAAAHPPVVQVPGREQLEAIEGHRREIARVESEVRQKLASFRYEEPPAPKDPSPPAAKELVWVDDEIPAGAAAEGDWKFVSEPILSGKTASTRTATGLGQHFFTGAKGPLVVAEGDVFFAHVYLDPKNVAKEVMLQWNDGSWEHRAAWGEDLIPWGADGTPSRRRLGPLPKAGEWARLEVPAALVGLGPGAKVNGWAFTQFDGTVYWDRAGIVTQAAPSRSFESLTAWVEAQRAAKTTTLPKDIQALVQLDMTQCGEVERHKLRDYFVEHVYSGSREVFDPLHKSVAEIQKRIEETDKAIPTTLVFKERPEPVEAHILKRGQYDQPGDKVSRNTPAFLPPLPEGAPRNRLGFARWLVDPSHPLTARVAVNRLWQQFFGTGIVKTCEDFGTQGEIPSHPELLDWLATEFIRTGWDVRKLVKLIVFSSSYRQSSCVTPDGLAKDPQDRLLARGPRFRLDAEMVRDQMLAASGLLVREVGGASVKPPQPAGLWEAVGYTGSNTARFSQDTGDRVYRRSLYTFWKRTAPPPQMAIFDAPSREMCTVRRERTNTPLQALLLMNETQCVESARHLAQRALKQAGSAPEARAEFLFRLLTARPAEEADLADLVSLYKTQLAEYRADADSARALIQIGDSKPDPAFDPAELAAWTVVGSLILNLDEVVTKG